MQVDEVRSDVQAKRHFRALVACTPQATPRRSSRVVHLGFTVIELLLVMSILGTLATIAVPQLDSIRDKARVTEALSDLKNIEAEILAYFATNGSVLPVDLDEVGIGGSLDPWGNAYVYNPHSTSIVYGCQSTTVGGNGNGGGGNGGGGGGQCTGPPPAGARRDKFLVPVNSDFDLFSAGPDGEWKAPFTAQSSRDDVVRAGNGGYFGVAEKF